MNFLHYPSFSILHQEMDGMCATKFVLSCFLWFCVQLGIKVTLFKWNDYSCCTFCKKEDYKATEVTACFLLFVFFFLLFHFSFFFFLILFKFITWRGQHLLTVASHCHSLLCWMTRVSIKHLEIIFEFRGCDRNTSKG